MTREDIATLLQAYKEGHLPEAAAVEKLSEMAFEEMGFAEIDHHRELRQGMPEFIYAAGKTPEQVRDIFFSLYTHSAGNLLATRASQEHYDKVREKVPEAVYDERARLIYLDRDKRLLRDEKHKILILTAGTSDVPVAEEARLTAYLCGNTVETYYDCGVAGIHRLFAHLPAIKAANVIIVIAGMEGALASVVGGLTDKPVIAVPTSVGYGAAFQGVAALLSMLNSCATGVSVVNIDNGFGAGVMASKINKLR